MDGSQADDFTSRQNIEETIIPFAMSYSNCVDKSDDAVDSSNLDICQHVPAAVSLFVTLYLRGLVFYVTVFEPGSRNRMRDASRPCYAQALMFLYQVISTTLC